MDLLLEYYLLTHKLFTCKHKLVSLPTPSVLSYHNILPKLDMT